MTVKTSFITWYSNPYRCCSSWSVYDCQIMLKVRG